MRANLKMGLAAVPLDGLDTVADDLPDFVFGHTVNQSCVVNAMTEKAPSSAARR